MPSKLELFNNLAGRLGPTPSPEFLATLQREGAIYDYHIDANGCIKVKPTPAVEWLERHPDDSQWHWMSIR